MQKNTTRREFMHAAAYAATGLVASAEALSAAMPEPQAPSPSASMAVRFRELMRGVEPFVCPAAHDALTARLIEVEGFKGLFIGTSAAASIGYALPDNGSISTMEILEYARKIAASVNIPALADADDFGNQPLNIYRNAREFQKAGIAAVMFDDRTPRARSNGTNDVISKNQMIDNIRAAADGRTDVVLTVRCYSTDRQDNLDRCIAYANAGADVIYPGAGLRTAEEFARVADAVKKPLMTTLNANMTVSRMKESRISVANGGSLVNIALGAVEKALIEMRTTGAMTGAQTGTLSRETALKLTRQQEMDEKTRKYNLR